MVVATAMGVAFLCSMTIISVAGQPSLAPATNNNDTSANCPLQCRNGGVCKPGPLPSNATANITTRFGVPLGFLDNMGFEDYHCDCPPNYVGLLCQHNYQECVPTNLNNGIDNNITLAQPDHVHTCFHGGTCVPLITGTESHFVCNCQGALDVNGTQYVGQYCESPLLPDDQCGFGENHFCLNNGTCSENDKACSCQEGYTGRLCEFQLNDLPMSTLHDDTTKAIECELDCWNDGECQLGFDPDNDASRTFQIAGTHTFQHCECKDGYGGVLCEQSLCPTRDCQNGSTCLQSTSSTTGKEVAVCDCTAATKHFPEGPELFAGENCEYQSTSICTNETSTDGLFFCVNNGTCLETTTPITMWICQCPDGFHGLQCEFKYDVDGDGESDKEVLEAANPCVLACENGGECVKGVKDTTHMGNSTGIGLLNQTYDENLEHCRCPNGFSGLTCQTKTEVCADPDRVHICFHGSKCVDRSGNGHWECDCDVADIHTAGESCQLQNPTPCDKEPRFCLNGGTCNEDLTLPFCACPDEYAGVHCEMYDPTVLLPPTVLATDIPQTTPIPTQPPTSAPVQPPSTSQPVQVKSSPPSTTSPAPFPMKDTPAPTPELKFDFNPATLILDDDFVEPCFDDDCMQSRGSNSNRVSGHSNAMVAAAATLIILSAGLLVVSVVLYFKTVRKEREMSSLMDGDTLDVPRGRRKKEQREQMGERAGQDLII